jgi:hypothetical protein
MVVVLIIRPDKTVFPLMDGDLLKWPTVREAREYVDHHHLDQEGKVLIIGLHDDEHKKD